MNSLARFRAALVWPDSSRTIAQMAPRVRATRCMNATAQALLVGCLLLAGCDSDEQAARVSLVPATGKLTVQGAPAIGAKITLHPQTSASGDLAGLAPHGEVGQDGTYQLSTYELNDGAPAGAYRVTVYWPDAGFQPRTPEEKENAVLGALPDKLRGRYREPAKSKLTLTVAEGQSQLPPLDLK